MLTLMTLMGVFLWSNVYVIKNLHALWYDPNVVNGICMENVGPGK